MSDFIQFSDNPLERDLEMSGNSLFNVYNPYAPVVPHSGYDLNPTPGLIDNPFFARRARRVTHPAAPQASFVPDASPFSIDTSNSDGMNLPFSWSNPTLLYSEPEPAPQQTTFVPDTPSFSIAVRNESKGMGLHSISSSSSAITHSPAPPSKSPRIPKNRSRTKLTVLPRYEYLLQHGTLQMHGSAVWIACNVPSCPFFGRPADMVRHLATHNPELRPRCGGCPAVLARQDALKRHLDCRRQCKYPDDERLEAREVYMQNARGKEKMRRCEEEESAKIRMALTHELIADFDDFVGKTRIKRGPKPRAA
ncbi:hypothetical protein FB45DRAFT_1006738 [Roridomyces roridus]|uniref:C2H2-type domain-containing protein n=1 Tax=Roridomyces roridus TaxID=1738132 RepID=A0AAD7F7K6_9AGAR|nr:hypothetical protein FB45DRAFT_1011454 [Roridomyces roridus]KAJ7621491.1 hypothetical protein FB45DRAFT_1006738 [Roridomyces roridus]